MSKTIRWDLTCVFAGWMIVGSFLWLATPWMTPFSAWLGPAWVWCGAVPAGALVLLMPRQALALAAAACGGVLAGVLAGLRFFYSAARPGHQRAWR